MQFDINTILLNTVRLMWADGFFWWVGGFIVIAFILEVGKDLLHRQSRIKWFLGKKNIQELQQLSPKEFEEWTAGMFRAMGYSARVVGGHGDGGIDVEAVKDGRVHYIQCKKYISRQVPVGAVRDFYGAIADKVDGGKGYFITTDVFTLDAEKFAEGKPLELVDRFKLAEYMKLSKVEVPSVKVVTVCPKCGGNLVERKSKFGRFLGCSNYPDCKYIHKE